MGGVYLLGLFVVVGPALVCWLILSLLLKGKSRVLALDSPNQRSLHERPTPAGGGIVIAGTVVLLQDV